MQFVVLATDKPGSLALRERTRAEHRLHLRNGDPHRVRVLLAGPTFEQSGQRMNGTLLVVEAEAIDAVSRFVADDPYVRAGLFERIDIRPWHCGLGGIEAAVPDPMADPR